MYNKDDNLIYQMIRCDTNFTSLEAFSMFQLVL